MYRDMGIFHHDHDILQTKDGRDVGTVLVKVLCEMINNALRKWTFVLGFGDNMVL